MGVSRVFCLVCSSRPNLAAVQRAAGMGGRGGAGRAVDCGSSSLSLDWNHWISWLKNLATNRCVVPLVNCAAEQNKDSFRFQSSLFGGILLKNYFPPGFIDHFIIT